MNADISYDSFKGFEIRKSRNIRRRTESARDKVKRKNVLSMFVHDMKNPVMSAEGSVSRLLQGKAGILTELQKDYLVTIKHSLGRMESLLMHFLEFLKIESKEFKPKFYPVDVVSALAKIVDDMRVEARKKDIQILFGYTQTDISIPADLMMLNSLISNLLDNAIKYTNSGGTITIEMSDRDDSVVVKIKDTGTGIPETHIPYIFNPFYRAQKDTEGSGLGLYIAKSVVEAHGGEIRVDSATERGSTFSFKLPKYRSATA